MAETWTMTVHTIGLERWDTAVTPPPGQTCTGRLNSKTRQVEIHCR
jgi:hypothetical protein